MAPCQGSVLWDRIAINTRMDLFCLKPKVIITSLAKEVMISVMLVCLSLRLICLWYTLSCFPRSRVPSQCIMPAMITASIKKTLNADRNNLEQSVQKIQSSTFTVWMTFSLRKHNSHTFLIDNHVRLHSSQNASYTGDVCDMHLRLTAKPHLCVICGTFHREVNTHLLLFSTHNLLIKR